MVETTKQLGCPWKNVRDINSVKSRVKNMSMSLRKKLVNQLNLSFLVLWMSWSHWHQSACTGLEMLEYIHPLFTQTVLLGCKELDLRSSISKWSCQPWSSFLGTKLRSVSIELWRSSCTVCNRRSMEQWANDWSQIKQSSWRHSVHIKLIRFWSLERVEYPTAFMEVLMQIRSSRRSLG